MLLQSLLLRPISYAFCTGSGLVAVVVVVVNIAHRKSSKSGFLRVGQYDVKPALVVAGTKRISGLVWWVLLISASDDG